MIEFKSYGNTCGGLDAKEILQHMKKPELRKTHDGWQLDFVLPPRSRTSEFVDWVGQFNPSDPDKVGELPSINNTLLLVDRHENKVFMGYPIIMELSKDDGTSNKVCCDVTMTFTPMKETIILNEGVEEPTTYTLPELLIFNLEE